MSLYPSQMERFFSAKHYAGSRFFIPYKFYQTVSISKLSGFSYITKKEE